MSDAQWTKHYILLQIVTCQSFDELKHAVLALIGRRSTQEVNIPAGVIACGIKAPLLLHGGIGDKTQFSGQLGRWMLRGHPYFQGCVIQYRVFPEMEVFWLACQAKPECVLNTPA